MQPVDCRNYQGKIRIYVIEMQRIDTKKWNHEKEEEVEVSR